MCIYITRAPSLWNMAGHATQAPRHGYFRLTLQAFIARVVQGYTGGHFLPFNQG